MDNFSHFTTKNTVRLIVQVFKNRFYLSKLLPFFCPKNMELDLNTYSTSSNLDAKWYLRLLRYLKRRRKKANYS
jgi:hypothetical protein